ncbi:winged helix-turn-helix transcriptional regulator [Devosia sp.]|uniref:winged helix-turn-helix transcriptional regulator n=1 Tax=Devosia sp. TaxID=1871048 RepID=UPI003A8F975A
MLGHLYDKQDCSAARALEIVGERWSLLILRDAMFRGHTRYSDFMKTLEIAPNILSKRLSGFVAAGLMVQGEDGAYQLTEKGLAFKPVIMALTAWGDQWVGPGPVEFITKDTRAPVRVELRGDAGEVTDLARVGVKPRD